MHKSTSLTQLDNAEECQCREKKQQRDSEKRQRQWQNKEPVSRRMLHTTARRQEEDEIRSERECEMLNGKTILSEKEYVGREYIYCTPKFIQT